MTLHEVSKASQLIHSIADPDANIIFGTVIDESMKDTVKVTVIATGFDQAMDKAVAAPTPVPAEEPARGAAARKSATPPPFPVASPTPPYLFEGRASAGAPIWEPSAAVDKQWEPFETPAFIRRTKHSSLRKSPHDVS